MYIDIIMLTLFSPVPLRELSASLYKNTLDHRWDRTMMDICIVATAGYGAPLVPCDATCPL